MICERYSLRCGRPAASRKLGVTWRAKEVACTGDVAVVARLSALHSPECDAGPMRAETYTAHCVLNAANDRTTSFPLLIPRRHRSSPSLDDACVRARSAGIGGRGARGSGGEVTRGSRWGEIGVLYRDGRCRLIEPLALG